MTSDDTYVHTLQATIEGLRYWVPSIADLARVAQTDAPTGWTMHVTPKAAGACPFALSLRPDRLYDLVLAGERYPDRPVIGLGLFLPLAAAVIDGRVVQRRWISSRTGAVRAVESLVTLPGGTLWREGGTPDLDGCESRDHHFLPYRR